ncbi:glycosyltransferase family A protein [Raineya sp.]|jgi:glycosyltransferase involved in cell wall biosynthesis
MRQENIEISIIIPCFNSGNFLLETLKSIDTSHPIMNHTEIIIINDGSSDVETIKILNDLSAKFLVLHKTNGGPASARNYGIKHSVGKYIFTLDSDNLILMDYLVIGKEILDKNEQIGVVYAAPEYFGDINSDSQTWQNQSLLSLAEANFIDMCAMFRKDIWSKVGGLNESKILIGHEDWEFWLKIALLTNKQFYFIDQKLFKYRVRLQDSVSIVYNNSCRKTAYKLHYLYDIRKKFLSKFLKRREISKEKYCEILGKITGNTSMLHLQCGSIWIALVNLFRNIFLYRYNSFEFIKGFIYWLKIKVFKKSNVL